MALHAVVSPCPAEDQGTEKGTWLLSLQLLPQREGAPLQTPQSPSPTSAPAQQLTEQVRSSSLIRLLCALRFLISLLSALLFPRSLISVFSPFPALCCFLFPYFTLYCSPYPCSAMYCFPHPCSIIYYFPYPYPVLFFQPLMWALLLANLT